MLYRERIQTTYKCINPASYRLHIKAMIVADTFCNHFKVGRGISILHLSKEGKCLDGIVQFRWQFCQQGGIYG